MSGQYPGHQRPPVGTPPPQTVWNHLTMTQTQGLNMHSTSLTSATLNPAGFYSHPSITRPTHLRAQLTPQLAHTQAPPTWHTPTVPSKTVSSTNTPGNPLFSLQMLVDNRQKQSQYINTTNSQTTLDLSSTSDMENFSGLPQDIPISLTARSQDKSGRNGSRKSPSLSLIGDISSENFISSSNQISDSSNIPVSLSTKDTTTPKITVKNFENNLRGISNIHDKMKEPVIDNLAQKIINLPPSVTIEKVITEKKDSENDNGSESTSIIPQISKIVMPFVVNLTSKSDKDIIDISKNESGTDGDKKIDESCSRSPKNLPKRSKRGVDSLLEKLEGGNKKFIVENNGLIVVPVQEDKDASSVRSLSPESHKVRSPNREEEVISPAFSNDDSNDIMKQRRKRKLEKPVRLSKDSKTELEDMELEPTEPTGPRTKIVSKELTECVDQPNILLRDPLAIEPVDKCLVETTDDRDPTPEKMKKVLLPNTEHNVQEIIERTNLEENFVDKNVDYTNQESQPLRRRRSSEGPFTNAVYINTRTRRKSSDDVQELIRPSSPKSGISNNVNPFNEVESELEKMFAGIVETVPQSKLDNSKKTGGSNQETVDPKTAHVVEANLQDSMSFTIDDRHLEGITWTENTKKPVKNSKKSKPLAPKRKTSKSYENLLINTSIVRNRRNAKRRRTALGKSQGAVKKAKKNVKIEHMKEQAYDSGSNASSLKSKGPVVHVEGSRDSPLSIQVVNAPREDEEEKNKEKRRSIGNGNVARSKRLSHQNDLDYRGKVSRAGLFSSTLSSRYDAHTTDSTWVCVFCKQGPHSIIPGDPSRPHPNLAGPHIIPGTYTVPAGILSDLFGPYLIGQERSDDSMHSADEQEISKEQTKGRKNKLSLRYAGLADQFSAKQGKSKKNVAENNANSIFTGMTLISGDEPRWEVWLHEQCAIWAAGVYMAGGWVTGLQEAVWDSSKSACNCCGLTGANIGCVKRGCKALSHYPCALTKGWLLDCSHYIPKCNVHRVT